MNTKNLSPGHSRPLSKATALGILLVAACEVVSAQGDSPTQLRQYIEQQVGGLAKLQVPATDAAIPLPRTANGAANPRYQTTEAKRYLGKMLFHDPVRTARININQGQPLDLPAGTAFGGTVSASEPNLPEIVNAQKQKTSCGTCHLGEAAGKAGQLLNFASGGEGRGYTDERGNFIPRRRPQSNLTKLRNTPIFPGDALVDALPTLADIFSIGGIRAVSSPARFYHLPPVDGLVQSGRLDELDSVGRQSPSMIGFAFNNRLLFGGLGGETPSVPGSLNPFNDPAQENLTLLLLDAHRMINFQSAELQRIPAYVQLFREAFPQEAAQADAKKDLSLLVNDDTEFRAQATFLRTAVTRDTPFDRFLAGQNNALTERQRRGARLFFTAATNGQGGAGCFTCHSGPMLNKQVNDPDVAGVGQFVEENFINVGIGDHPVQALNAAARGRLDFSKTGPDGFPYHAEDTGREEVTQNPADVYKFRVVTLRQLKDARTFFHNGSFTKLRDVVQYFNLGIPQDPTAGAAASLSARFTNPRGPGAPRGLGLTEEQVDDLTDFLENGLYDPAFVEHDPNSPTKTLQLNERDVTYSKYRPDLAALGAKDGFPLSGLAPDNNDPLSRRDLGLDFLDVSSQTISERIGFSNHGSRQIEQYRITNKSQSVVDTHLLIIVRGLPVGVQLENASGTTRGGDPYIRVFLSDGVIRPGQSIVQSLNFKRQGGNNAPITYALDLLSGQGNP